MKGAVRAMSLVAAAASLGVVAIALAQGTGTDGPATARLSWSRGVGAESCPDRVALEKDVSARLGRDAFAEPVRRSIEGTVVKDGTRWIAKLYIRQLDGTLIGSRDLNSEAADCKPLGSAA